MMMRRSSTMTLGFVLILIGIQLNVIQSYELTPRFSNFLSENGGKVAVAPAAPNSANVPADSPYYQASFSNNANPAPAVGNPAGTIRSITTPRWMCWPVLFLGAVVFLHGLGKPVNQ